MRKSIFLVLLLFASSISFSQHKAVHKALVSQDPTAVAIAQKALTAMGGSALASYQDSTANGSVTIYGSTNNMTASAVIQSKGLQELHYDLQKSQGTDTYITDGTSACLTRWSGPQQVDFINLYSQRIDHIPAFSLLAQYANGNMSVQYSGTATVNGQVADVITLSFSVSPPPGGYDPVAITQHSFYVDQATGLVTKMQYTRFADNDPNTTFNTEVYFSNYQVVSGISVPFVRDIVIDGQPASNLTLTSVAFNTGLPDSLFNGVCGGGQ